MAPLSKPEADKLKEDFLVSLIHFLDASSALGEGIERDTYISEYRSALNLPFAPAPPLSGGQRIKRRPRASRKSKSRYGKKQTKRNRRR